MKDIVLFGVQWSWKWTQSTNILNKFSWSLVYFEAWNILRALKSKPNALGDYVKKTIDDWNLVKDEFISSLFDALASTLESNQSILLDWYPRKIEQMNHFLTKMDELWRDFVAVFLDLDEDVAINRLSSRRVCSDCWTTSSSDHSNCPSCGSINLIQREDDNPSAIQKRVNLYKSETKPVIDHFNKLWKLKVINANWSIDEVFNRILEIVN